VQHGAGGRLVDAARLHADEPAFDQVGAPDAVPSGDRVQLLHQLHRADFRPSSATGTPRSKPMRTVSGRAGWRSGLAVSL